MSDAHAAHLSVRDLHHAYGSRTVLAGLDLRVASGELVGLLSPNGGGKSTALALLAGLVPLRRGEVRWTDHTGRSHAVASHGYRARLGMVFQHPSLDRQLTARQNLSLAAQLQGLRRSEATARVEALLAWADLADRAADPVRTLSGGMQRRLEFARAIVHAPELLLLDEPTTGLDAPSFARTWALVANLRAEHDLSVVLATHRPDEASRCDRLVLLDGGRAVRVATPAALVAELAEDLLVLEADAPAELAADLARDFAVAARVDEHGRVVVECARGHELLVRVVEALPAGRLASASLRRPTLADVFAKLTGTPLARDPASAPDAPTPSAEAA